MRCVIKISESQIEKAICMALTKMGLFVVKLKDQSAYRDGAFRKGSAWQVRGVPDLVVFAPNSRCVWLEVKTPSGKLSDHQERFKSKISSLGHEIYVVRSVRDAKKIFHSDFTY